MNESAASPARTLESHFEAMDALLKQVIAAGGFELSFRRQKAEHAEDANESAEYVVDFSGPDTDLLLEKNGALLNALEYVVLKAVRLEEEYFNRISFDSGDWRRLRTEELKLTARVAAERVIETGEPFTLNPMNPRERRIIHLALHDLAAVRTSSEGAGADRKVVILPAASPPRGPRR